MMSPNVTVLSAVLIEFLKYVYGVPSGSSDDTLWRRWRDDLCAVNMMVFVISLYKIMQPL